MSRFADAQRRAGAFVAADATDAWGFDRVESSDFPFFDWGPPSATTDPDKVRRFPQRPIDSTARGPVVFQPGVVAKPGSLDARVELSALVTRVFSTPPGGAGARAALFCTVNQDGTPNRVAREAAQLMAQQQHARPVCLLYVRIGSEPLEVECASEPALGVFSMDVGTAHARLPELLEQFEFVLMAGSQSALTPPVMGLAVAVDATVLLVSAAFTRRQAAKSMVEALQSSGAALLGVVLTDRTCPIPAGIYRRL